MTRHDYIHEVTALTAPAALRQRIAALPDGAGAKGQGRPRRMNWMGLTAALVLVVGLGLIAPAIYGALRVGGEVTPPPIETIAPEGIIAEGIDVSPVILDAAKEHVQERLVWRSEHSGVTEFVDGQWREKDLGPLPQFDNWRIEGLSAVYERKVLRALTVDVYRLDYRLHTTTPERVVLAGGMELNDEGWLLDTYPESTYLVFLLDYSTPHYFATMINDCSPGSALFDESIEGDIDAYLARLGGDTTPDPWGITLHTENVTPTGLTLVCSQSGGSPAGVLQTGRAYTLERYTDGAWVAVETASGEAPGWLLDAQLLPTGDSTRWEIDFSQIYHPLPPATYRIGKKVDDFRATGDYDEKNYYAEFTITQELQGVAIDALDYTKLEAQLSAGDWAALQDYFPVLREGASFHWVAEEGVTGGGGNAVTLEEYYAQRFGLDAPEGKLDLERFTLFGFNGTGKQDLVLGFFNLGGNYLILHREGEEFYGFERGYRSFMELQQDGVYATSSGAMYTSYHRIQFYAGFYEEELLGQRAGEGHEIGGIPVSEEYFWTWRQNLMVGDTDWYYPAQPTGRKPPPSTEAERREHISIQALPLESPFDELPEGLLATLESTGEVVKREPGSPFLMKTYRSPSLVVQTLMISPEELKKTLAEGTFTQEEYDAALDAEYIYTVQPLDSSYPTGSGLRLGDSVERARELFYSLHDTGTQNFQSVLAILTITTENGVVTGLFSSSGGRTVGNLTY